MPLMTNDDLAERYPQTVNNRTRINVADLKLIGIFEAANVWLYYPLRAADGLDCFSKIVRAYPYPSHDPEYWKCELRNNSAVSYLSPDGFVYVDESTLALIQNYR